MSTASKVEFEPRWKEELVCLIDGRRFVLECSMGALTVYYPTLSMWESLAPEWAIGQWQRISDDLSDWCNKQKIPLFIEDHARVHFD